MTADMYLTIDDVKGGSIDEHHPDAIEVESFAWGVDQSTTPSGAGGRGAGKVTFDPVVVTKAVDRSSPELFGLCCTGRHLAKAVLTVRKAGARSFDYLTVTLEDVVIAGIDTSGADGSALTEQVRLRYGRISVDYVPQRPDGSPGEVVHSSWDLRKNAAASST